MAGSETKTDTALFQKTVETLQLAVKGLGEQLSRWQQTVGDLRGKWQGDASDNVRNTSAQVEKSADALLRSLSGYQSTLRELAGIYDKTEKSVQESGKSLKFGDVFQ